MSTAWPDTFTYVCNATRAAVVNGLPLAYAGIERIKRIVVFCGAADRPSANAHEMAEAILPAQAFAAALAEWSGGRLAEQAGTLQIVYGPASSIADWTSRMNDVLAQEVSREKVRPCIVYNLKGGTKEMALGGMLGLHHVTDVNHLLLTVSDGPLRIEMVAPDTQDPMPNVAADLSLRQYLALYGFSEYFDSNQQDQRAYIERRYRDWRWPIRRFSEEFLPSAVTAWPVLQRWTQPLDDKRGGWNLDFDIIMTNPETIPSVDQHVVLAALGALDGMGGLDIQKGVDGLCTSCVVRTPLAARFLRGGWLEALLFLRLLEVADKHKDVTIATTLGLAYLNDRKQQVTEIDIAVLVRSQLLIVEAKSSAMSSRATRANNERSFAQMDSNKKALLGQVGRAVVVNPCVEPGRFETLRGGVAQRLVRGGEEILLGPTAVDDMVNLVRTMIGRN